MSERDVHASENGKHSSASSGETVQFLDILVLLARGRSLLVGTILVFLLGGLAYGIVASPIYTSTARVVPEAQSEGPQGLGGLSGGISALQGLGVNLGNFSEGLSTDSYPEILKGREVGKAVVRDTFQFPDQDTVGTLVEYYTDPGKLGPVGRLKEMLGEWVGGQEDSLRTGELLTREEEKVIGRIQEKTTAYKNPETGLMKISVATEDPRLSTQLVNSFVEHLSSHVRTLRTRKARQNLNFIRKRFDEAGKELSLAEQRLARFMDRNQDINTAELRTERDRLQRQVRFKSDLYSELQAQLTQAEIDLQRSEPVITMVEEPVPPLEPTSPQRLAIVILSLLGGVIVGIGIILLRAFFREENTSGERRAKIQEVREAFYPERLVSSMRRRIHEWGAG
jgi:tyrosine-protein kinase Etk/Wzc